MKGFRRLRRPLAHAAIIMLMLRSLAGCHSYAPADRPLPVAGTRVKVVYALPQTVVVRFGDGDSTVRAGVLEVVGTLRSVQADSLHLSGLRRVSGIIVVGREGDDSDFAAATTTVTTTGADVRAEKFAPGRTGLGSVLVVVALFAIVAAIGLIVGFERGSY